jgi:phosphatidate cytidylyltransferase
MSSGLRARVVTAIVLAAPTLAVTLWDERWAVAAWFGLFLGQAALEWMRLVDPERRVQRLLYALALVGAAGLVYGSGPAPGAALALVAAGCLWWCVGIAWIILYETREWMPRGRASALMAAGWVFLLPGWTALVVLHEGGGDRLLLLLCIVWTADAAAFFGGRRWGKTRLAARISPAKTWEGVAAAAAAVSALSLVAAALYGLSVRASVVLCVIALVTLAVSIAGDLFKSLVKRLRGVKDSGSLLPGHGGVLDRIDSLTAAAPMFLAGLSLTQVLP